MSSILLFFGLQLYYCHGNTDFLLVSPNLIFHLTSFTKCVNVEALLLETIKTQLLDTWRKYKPIILQFIMYRSLYCIKFTATKHSINKLHFQAEYEYGREEVSRLTLD